MAHKREALFFLLIAFWCVAAGRAVATVSPDARIRAELQALFLDPPSVQGFPYEDLLSSAAAKYGLPLPLVVAVARGESFFDPKARSIKGALGVMQVMPATAADYGLTPEDLLDPARNIDVGVHYLADLQAQLRDPYLALAAYYCGSRRVDKDRLTVGDECDEYVRYIHSHLQKVMLGESGRLPSKGVEAKELVIAGFDNFLDAERFFHILSEKLPDLRIDLFRREVSYPGYDRYQYEILLPSDQRTARDEVCQAIEQATGFAFCP